VKLFYKYFIFNKIKITTIYIHSKFIHSKFKIKFIHSFKIHSFTHSLIGTLMSQINITTPPSITQSANQIGGITVTTAPAMVSDTEHDDFEQDEYKDINAGVFFDGTLNNRTNVNARIEHENGASGNKALADLYIKGEGSFENEHSNISRSEPAYDEFQRGKLIQFRLYIEGAGTEDGQSDSSMGMGMGTGSTGVPAKVKKACKKVVDKIKQKGVKFIDTLTVDTFGFSRGAASSRHFIFEMYKRKGQVKAVYTNGTQAPPTIITYDTDYGALGEALKANGIEIRSLVVRFTGLYDTVASFGVIHSNDTRELGLDAVRYSVHVLQLAAADEHRANFRLTNINSKGSLERFLPGVHSDIGGGYIDGADENVKLNKSGWLPTLEKDRDYLIEQGWYKPHQITVDKFWGTLNAERNGIKYHYSFIPLHIMVEYAVGKQVEFIMSKITNKYKINGEVLTKTKTRLDNYISGNADKMSLDNPNDRELLKQLRNEYFHFSAHFAKTAWVLTPHKPQFVNGERHRIIQNG